jgi:hypothetical protein
MLKPDHAVNCSSTVHTSVPFSSVSRSPDVVAERGSVSRSTERKPATVRDVLGRDPQSKIVNRKSQIA